MTARFAWPLEVANQALATSVFSGYESKIAPLFVLRSQILAVPSSEAEMIQSGRLVTFLTS